MGKSQTKASNKYHEKAYDRLYPFVPKGHKAEIQAAADAAGESLNDFIVTAIDERMTRLRRAERPFAPPLGEWCTGCAKLGARQYTPAGSTPEPEHPWCYAYLCKLEGTEDKARKCEECAEKSRGAHYAPRDEENPPED